MTVIRSDDLVFVSLPGRQSADGLAGIASASSVRSVRLEHTPGRTAHRHPHSEEVVYVVSGAGTVWIDGETTTVTAGDIVHIPPGCAHATVPVPGSVMELTCYFPHPDLGVNVEETDIDVTMEDQ